MSPPKKLFIAVKCRVFIAVNYWVGGISTGADGGHVSALIRSVRMVVRWYGITTEAISWTDRQSARPGTAPGMPCRRRSGVWAPTCVDTLDTDPGYMSRKIRKFRTIIIRDVKFET